MKYIFIYFSLIFLFGCSTKKSGNEKSIKPIANKLLKIDTIATFVDSTSIASHNKNKLYLANVLIDDSIYKTFILFYSKKDRNWLLKYKFEDEQWSGSDLNLEITDFNNDGYKDLTYLKGTGARGGNAIMNLFIYDKKGDSLIYILNSNEYPNLYYNKETSSINSYILTGGNETVFMRLSNHILQPFASIFQDEKHITVSEYNSIGQSKVVYVDFTNNYDLFTRFTNYKPLEVEK